MTNVLSIPKKKLPAGTTAKITKEAFARPEFRAAEDLAGKWSDLTMEEKIAAVHRIQRVMSFGVCHGLGHKGTPGGMCVEACVNYALGNPHGDKLAFCVDKDVNSWLINLNDQPWSTNLARAEHLMDLAIAQLGTKDVAFNLKGSLAEAWKTRYRPLIVKTVRQATYECFPEANGKLNKESDVITYLETKRTAKDVSSEGREMADSLLYLYGLRDSTPGKDYEPVYWTSLSHQRGWALLCEKKFLPEELLHETDLAFILLCDVTTEAFRLGKVPGVELLDFLKDVPMVAAEYAE